MVVLLAMADVLMVLVHCGPEQVAYCFVLAVVVHCAHKATVKI